MISALKWKEWSARQRGNWLSEISYGQLTAWQVQISNLRLMRKWRESHLETMLRRLPIHAIVANQQTTHCTTFTWLNSIIDIFDSLAKVRPTSSHC